MKAPAKAELKWRIEQLEAELATVSVDSKRLNFLEMHRIALNTRYQTDYGWKFIANHNVTRVFCCDVNTLDLYDAHPGSGDIRSVIDKAIVEDSGSAQWDAIKRTEVGK